MQISLVKADGDDITRQYPRVHLTNATSVSPCFFEPSIREHRGIRTPSDFSTKLEAYPRPLSCRFYHYNPISCPSCLGPLCSVLIAPNPLLLARNASLPHLSPRDSWHLPPPLNSPNPPFRPYSLRIRHRGCRSSSTRPHALRAGDIGGSSELHCSETQCLQSTEL